MKEQVIKRIHVKGFKGQRMYIQDVCNGDKKGIGLGNPFGYTIYEREEKAIATVVTDKNKYRHYRTIKDIENMSKYKVSVSKDEMNFFWIVEDKEMIIKNPTEEDLKDAELEYYNRTNICHRCREENNIIDNSILYPGNANHEKGKDRKEIIERATL